MVHLHSTDMLNSNENKKVRIKIEARLIYSTEVLMDYVSAISLSQCVSTDKVLDGKNIEFLRS